MHAVKLTDSHREEFYNFLAEQLEYAIVNNKQWHLPKDTSTIKYNSNNRQLYGVYQENKLIAVGGYVTLSAMPYRLLDTFTIQYSLTTNEMSATGGCLANKILSDCVQDKIYTVYHAGENRMWKLLGFHKKGFFWKHVENWIPKKVSVIPANQKSKHTMINHFLDNTTHPVDMLIYKVEYDTALVEEEELFEHG